MTGLNRNLTFDITSVQLGPKGETMRKRPGKAFHRRGNLRNKSAYGGQRYTPTESKKHRKK